MRRWNLHRAVLWLGVLALLAGSCPVGLRPAQAGGTQGALFSGVYYIHETRSDPRPLSIHVVIIDLNAPGIGFFTTPADTAQGGVLPARTTSQFLREFGLQVAVNGDFFRRISTGDWRDFFFVPGAPVQVLGLASSAGAIYSPVRPYHPSLYISADNRASFEPPADGVYHAISGDCLFMVFGRFRAACDRHHTQQHPRTVAALDGLGETLLLFVVDGRQPGFSEGVTLEEMAAIVEEYGGYAALNLDGGGSTTLVIEDESGAPRVLNSPVHNDIPGLERPVANHLGVFARPHAAWGG